ncbi:hypothetical protein [Halorarum salinum]|uniref:Uncharacterized protein n=1 Tax=Halorarum salinum TaxID=2743089 RepID=A0A7D5LCP8_9EURY|nr:hypothetical protein [Halobaculum salinum]QLG63766.1 hypothetical protein HUG12_19370 [Halobaculum salinum]
MRLRRVLPSLPFPAVLLVALAGVVVRRAVRGAREVPLSPLSAGRRVGPDWPERVGIAVDTGSAGEPGGSNREPVVGEMDDLTAYERPGFDSERVAPVVRGFYERTAEFEMEYAVRWHGPFRAGAALVSPLTSAIGQLNLPGRSGPGGRLHGRFAAVRPGIDPREGARAWVRTDEDGAAVFVAVYASHERDGERFVNVAVPLPGGNLSTVLRIDHLDPDGEGGTVERGETASGTGVRLHTDGPGDPGLYLSTPVGPFELPLDQSFAVEPAGPDEEGDLRASHEMWVLGRRFLTVSYRIYASTSTS